MTVLRILVQMTDTKFQNPSYQLDKTFTARVKNTKYLWQRNGMNKMLKGKCIRKQNEASKIISKFAASDVLQISQLEVISECESLLNCPCSYALLFYVCNLCLT